jgi:hypothetical protein
MVLRHKPATTHAPRSKAMGSLLVKPENTLSNERGWCLGISGPRLHRDLEALECPFGDRAHARVLVVDEALDCRRHRLGRRAGAVEVGVVEALDDAFDASVAQISFEPDEQPGRRIFANHFARLDPSRHCRQGDQGERQPDVLRQVRREGQGAQAPRGYFHDLNDTGKEVVMADIVRWFDARLPAKSGAA